MKKLYPNKKDLNTKDKFFLYLKRNYSDKKGKILLSGLVILILIICGFVTINYTTGTSNVSSNNHTVTNNSYTINIIDTDTGGNLTKNSAFTQSLPKTELNDQILSAAENGTPMITFGNGSEPRVMITAGVHGAELPAQIAAMNLINNLTTQKIKGTIYIVPIVAPCDTAANTRLYHGKNLNIITTTPGSPTNLIVRTAVKNNVTYLGDFHSSQPNDVPGKNCVIYYNNNKSYQLAKYMTNSTKLPLVEVTPYQGLLTTSSTNNNITSIVCEVLSPHGKVKAGSPEISNQNMIAFLQYTGIL